MLIREDGHFSCNATAASQLPCPETAAIEWLFPQEKATFHYSKMATSTELWRRELPAILINKRTLERVAL
jgi:hypothetical protein